MVRGDSGFVIMMVSMPIIQESTCAKVVFFLRNSKSLLEITQIGISVEAFISTASSSFGMAFVFGSFTLAVGQEFHQSPTLLLVLFASSSQFHLIPKLLMINERRL